MTFLPRATASTVATVVSAPLLAAMPSAALTDHDTGLERHAVVSTTSTVSTADDTTSPLPGGTAVANVAHKGASVDAPENTLSAVRQAIAKRANFVGIDVRRTRDHRLVVLHDARLRRTTNVEQVFPERASWTVDRFTLAEIRRLDAGRWVSQGYTGERIPTLGQVLNALAPSSTGAFLEIKQANEYGGVSGIGDQVVRAIEEHTRWLSEAGPDNRLVVQAFNDRFLKRFEAKHDQVVVGTLGPADGLDGYATWADQINVHHRDVNGDLVADAHRAGLAVSTYIVNDAALMDEVIGSGVDAISTDYPSRLHRVLSSRSQVMADTTQTQPPAEPETSVLSLAAPGAALLRSRVPLRVELRGSDEAPAPWTWVQVQLRDDGRWRTLQERVTDRFGNLRTSVRARPRLSLRVVSAETDWYAASEPILREIETRRADTKTRLYGDSRIAGGTRARLRVRWTAEDGRRVAGPATLWARPEGRRWRRIREFRVRDGYRRIQVSPSRDTRYQVRARRGSWWTGDRDNHHVDTRRVDTRIRLYGDRRVVGGRRARLRVRWTAEDGRRVAGPATLWARPEGRRWRRIREFRVRDGHRRIRVSPSRDTRYRIRARRGSWWTGDRDNHYVNHVR